MSQSRLEVLDGWRGLSILLVLLGHLFPMGPAAWNLNVAVAGCGMAIFFTLSGFLIASLLLRDSDIRSFLIHRVMRIVPLAWIAMALVLASTHADLNRYPPLLLFYANELNVPFLPGTGHFWSLCVEFQFYLFVAAIVSVFGRRALYVLPILALAVTAFRVSQHELMIINTEYRVDEILSGATLALVWHSRQGLFQRAWLGVVPVVAAPILLLSAGPMGGALDYARPYIAASMVGATLGLAEASSTRQFLANRSLKYLATVSYALYVVHGCLVETWLSSGSKTVKYLKRPLFLVVTFALAHLSTRYYEPFFIDLGKRWAKKRRGAEPVAAKGVSKAV